MQHRVESLFKTLTCKMCPLETKIQIWLHSINACLCGEWWSHHWQKYLLHLGKKERKHFALIFIPNSSQTECTRPDIKRSIAPYNRLKNHITNYRNKKISFTNGTRIEWSDVTTAAFKNDNTLKLWAYSDICWILDSLVCNNVHLFQ